MNLKVNHIKGLAGFATIVVVLSIYHFLAVQEYITAPPIFPTPGNYRVAHGGVYVFPNDFTNEKLDKYMPVLDANGLYRYNGSTVPATSFNDEFHLFKMNIFGSLKNIDGDQSKCKDINVQRQVDINKSQNINIDIEEVMQKFIQDMPQNLYYREVAPYFIDGLKDQLKEGTVKRHWYQLAGSSVWLEQYGVYFTIRRVMYSPAGFKNAPLLSLTYAQIFDDQWREIKDHNLVLPHEDESENGLEILKFPLFLKIPFFHDYDQTKKRYYGPEDPRITLIKNKAGHFEPLIVFNSDHRQLVTLKDSDTLEPQNFRSMFLCFPFQHQVGKANVDAYDQERFSDATYSRVSELRLDDGPRLKVQKNWTPFISHSQRLHNGGYDTHVNFVYRWTNLEVLQCDIHDGTCNFLYRLDSSIERGSAVGPMRGGTELYSINELLINSGVEKNYYLPPNREVWVGFARAHLDGCGCGKNMYRPNLVVIVGDTVEGEFIYKISHISSSLSFDMNVVGWDMDNPENLCTGSNVLIPNGIASWVVDLATDEAAGWPNDVLTLSLSVSDISVEIINIKNLLAEIIKFSDVFHDQSLAKPYIPSSTTSSKLIGYNNDNVKCTLRASEQFCAAYGKAFEESQNDANLK